MSSLAVFQLSVDVHKYARLPACMGLLQCKCTVLSCKVLSKTSQAHGVLLVCVLPEGRAVYNRAAACGSKVWHVCVSEKIAEFYSNFSLLPRHTACYDQTVNDQGMTY